MNWERDSLHEAASQQGWSWRWHATKQPDTLEMNLCNMSGVSEKEEDTPNSPSDGSFLVGNHKDGFM